MRYLYAMLLAVLLAVPAAAQPTLGLPYTLTFSEGTIAGTFGGVPVTGTFTDTTFELVVDGEVFANGTFTCTGDVCTFTVTELLGISTSFTFNSNSLAPAVGNITGVFRNHGVWVSSVAKWSKAHLTTMRVGQVVRAAASIKAQSQLSTEISMKSRGKGKGQGRGK